MQSYFEKSIQTSGGSVWVPHVYQARFYSRTMATMPRKLQAFAEKTFSDALEKGGRFEANNALQAIAERAEKQGRDGLNSEAIKEQATAAVVACFRAEVRADKWEVVSAGVEIARGFGIETAAMFKHGLEGVVARFQSTHWWFGQIVKAQKRQDEEAAIRRGRVCKGGELYATDDAVFNLRQKKKEAREYMERMVLESEEGDVIGMMEAANSGISNPEVLNAELMNRINGYQDCASRRKHIGIFVTATAPSRFHRSGAGFDRNSTPRNAQKYMAEVWSRTRAALAYAKVAIHGLRVIEPHHDGCPHWHMIVFMRKGDAPKFRKIFADYFRAEDAHELISYAAKRARVDFKTIDPTKGSAAAYVAKYIAKNINGRGVGVDMEGDVDAIEALERVLAWKSVHGFRQFQAIGGHYVSTYREVRRLKELERSSLPDSMLEAYDSAQTTADKFASFGDFMEALGGIETRPKDARVRIEAGIEHFDGVYGVAKRRKVIGLRHELGVLLSGRKVWKVKAKKSAIN